MHEKPLVLFVCTHNAARSQMAEALLRKYGGDRFQAASAGFEPTDVHPLTRAVLAEVGIDVSGLHAKGVREFLAKRAVRYASAGSSTSKHDSSTSNGAISSGYG